MFPWAFTHGAPLKSDVGISEGKLGWKENTLTVGNETRREDRVGLNGARMRHPNDCHSAAIHLGLNFWRCCSRIGDSRVSTWRRRCSLVIHELRMLRTNHYRVCGTFGSRTRSALRGRLTLCGIKCRQVQRASASTRKNRVSQIEIPGHCSRARG